MHLGIGDKERFELAIRYNRIKDCPVSDLEAILRLIMLKIGVRAANLPNKEEKGLILAHVIGDYGNHTIQEINLAFDMAIMGKLYEWNSKFQQIPVDANCYENFSCIYISKIMNAYRRWAHETHTELQYSKHWAYSQEQGVKQIGYDVTLHDSDMREWVNDLKTSIRTTENIPLIPLMIYDWLVKNGDISISDYQESDIQKSALSIRRHQISEDGNTMNVLKFENSVSKGGLDKNDKRLVDMIAKKICVFQHLKSVGH